MFTPGGRARTDRICVFYQRGHCKFGAKCRFQHIKTQWGQEKKTEPVMYKTYYPFQHSSNEQGKKNLGPSHEKLGDKGKMGQDTASSDVAQRRDFSEGKDALSLSACDDTSVVSSALQSLQEAADQIAESFDISNLSGSGGEDSVVTPVSSGSPRVMQKEPNNRETNAGKSSPGCRDKVQDSSVSGKTHVKSTTELADVSESVSGQQDFSALCSKSFTDLLLNESTSPVVEESTLSPEKWDLDTVGPEGSDGIVVEKRRTGGTAGEGSVSSDMINRGQEITGSFVKEVQDGDGSEFCDNTESVMVFESPVVEGFQAEDDLLLDGTSQLEKNEKPSEYSTSGKHVGGFITDSSMLLEAVSILVTDKESSSTEGLGTVAIEVRKCHTDKENIVTEDDSLIEEIHQCHREGKSKEVEKIENFREAEENITDEEQNISRMSADSLDEENEEVHRESENTVYENKDWGSTSFERKQDIPNSVNEEKQDRPREAVIIEEKGDRQREEEKVEEEEDRDREVAVTQEKEQIHREAEIVEEEKRSREAEIVEEEEKSREAEIVEEELRPREAGKVEEEESSREAEVVEEEDRDREAEIVEEEERSRSAEIVEEEESSREAEIVEEEDRDREAEIVEEEERSREAEIAEEEEDRDREAEIDEEEEDRDREAEIAEEEEDRDREAEIVEEEESSREAEIVEEEEDRETEIGEEEERPREAEIVEEEEDRDRGAAVIEEKEERPREAEIVQEEGRLREAEIVGEKEESSIEAVVIEDKEGNSREAEIVENFERFRETEEVDRSRETEEVERCREAEIVEKKSHREGEKAEEKEESLREVEIASEKDKGPREVEVPPERDERSRELEISPDERSREVEIPPEREIFAEKQKRYREAADFLVEQSQVQLDIQSDLVEESMLSSSDGALGDKVDTLKENRDTGASGRRDHTSGRDTVVADHGNMSITKIANSSQVTLTALEPITVMVVEVGSDEGVTGKIEPEDDPLSEQQQDRQLLINSENTVSAGLYVPHPAETGTETDLTLRIKKDPWSINAQEMGNMEVFHQEKILVSQVDDAIQAGMVEGTPERKFQRKRKMEKENTNQRNSLRVKNAHKESSATGNRKMKPVKSVQKVTAGKNKNKVRQRGKEISDLRRTERKLKKLFLPREQRSGVFVQEHNFTNLKREKRRGVADESVYAKSRGKNAATGKDGSAPIKKPMFFDPNLPSDWCRMLTQRQSGASAGMWDVYIVSPEGKRFRSRTQLKKYLIHSEIDLDADAFNFNPYGRQSNAAPASIDHLRKTRMQETKPSTKSLQDSSRKLEKVVSGDDKSLIQRIGRSGRVIKSKFMVNELLGKTRGGLQRQPKQSGTVANVLRNVGDKGCGTSGSIVTRQRGRTLAETPTKIIKSEPVSEENATNTEASRHGRFRNTAPSEVVTGSTSKPRVLLRKYPNMKVVNRCQTVLDNCQQHKDGALLLKSSSSVEETDKQHKNLTKAHPFHWQQVELKSIPNDTSQNTRQTRRLRRSKFAVTELLNIKSHRGASHHVESHDKCKTLAVAKSNLKKAEKLIPRVVLHRLPTERNTEGEETAVGSKRRRRRTPDTEAELSPEMSRVGTLAPPEEHSFYDNHLPQGWCRKVLIYREGVSTGIWKVYFRSPDGSKFHSQQDLESYIKANKLNIDVNIFKFSVFTEVSRSDAVFEENKEPLKLSETHKSKNFSPLYQESEKVKKESCLKQGSLIRSKRHRVVRFDLHELFGKKKCDHANVQERSTLLMKGRRAQISSQKLATGELQQDKERVNSIETRRTRLSTKVTHGGQSSGGTTEDIPRMCSKNLRSGKVEQNTSLILRNLKEQTLEKNRGKEGQKLPTVKSESTAVSVQRGRVRRHFDNKASLIKTERLPDQGSTSADTDVHHDGLRHLRQSRKRKFIIADLLGVRKRESSPGLEKTVNKSEGTKLPLAKRTRRSSLPREDFQPMLIDPNLPKGWARVVKQQESGAAAGAWNVYIYSPDGKIFRSRNELQAYLKQKNLELDADSFDFSVSGQRKK